MEVSRSHFHVSHTPFVCCDTDLHAPPLWRSVTERCVSATRGRLLLWGDPFEQTFGVFRAFKSVLQKSCYLLFLLFWSQFQSLCQDVIFGSLTDHWNEMCRFERAELRGGDKGAGITSGGLRLREGPPPKKRGTSAQVMRLLALDFNWLRLKLFYCVT